jgi:hypothetical protein
MATGVSADLAGLMGRCSAQQAHEARCALLSLHFFVSCTGNVIVCPCTRWCARICRVFGLDTIQTEDTQETAAAGRRPSTTGTDGVHSARLHTHTETRREATRGTRRDGRSRPECSKTPRGSLQQRLVTRRSQHAGVLVADESSARITRSRPSTRAPPPRRRAGGRR